ncbi:MAG TPA: HD domain-containing protein [Solirubrobacterales bacterium]|jgi:(p)ppGpp synthase/HD superfamily hydrolase|nr:HD domain-containing protein [Solirubrobacterales bacterium]
MPDTPRIEAAAQRSPMVRQALRTAHAAHAGQIRNGSGGMPYVEHPRGVAEMLCAEGFGEEVVAAGLLHDVVEDSELTVEDLRRDFGDRVSGLVGALSDDESIEPYRERKVEHRERVAAAGREALAIYAADKLFNVRSLRGALAGEDTEQVAGEFKVSLEVKLDVWEADLALLREKAADLPFVGPLREELSALRAELGAPAPHP